MRSELKVLYHFTSTAHLPLIAATGFLKLVESNVGSADPSLPPFGEHVGPDVVWLVDRPELGDLPHGLVGSVHDKREVRFTVRCRATPWLAWRPADRMHPEWRQRMIHVAGGMAAARRWWVCESPIKRAAWRAVDVRQADGTWRSAHGWVEKIASTMNG